jgi:hypothetical protein
LALKKDGGGERDAFVWLRMSWMAAWRADSQTSMEGRSNGQKKNFDQRDSQSGFESGVNKKG